MPILGYGEDALTYWAFSQHMAQVIGPLPLGDNSPLGEVLFVYRPSFGRAGGEGGSQFGEFDAIVGTPVAVYLVESKWRLPILDGQLTLAQRQVVRHRIFRWLREHWFAQHPDNWGQFVAANDAQFRCQFHGLHLAQPTTILASNLEFLLRQLDNCGQKIYDVLLYFRLADGPWPENGVVVPGGGPPFVVIPFVYQPLNHGGIINMEA